MNKQYSHHNRSNAVQKRNLVLLSDGVTGPANIGGLFRLCDSFGVKEIVMGHSNPELGSARFKKAARNTQQVVTHRFVSDLSKEISELKKNQFYILGLEITTQSIPVQTLEIPKEKAIALVIGGERHGISETVLQCLDGTVHIEMFGTNSSMNVTQATAIALYELSKS